MKKDEIPKPRKVKTTTLPSTAFYNKVARAKKKGEPVILDAIEVHPLQKKRKRRKVVMAKAIIKVPNCQRCDIAKEHIVRLEEEQKEKERIAKERMGRIEAGVKEVGGRIWDARMDFWGHSIPILLLCSVVVLGIFCIIPIYLYDIEYNRGTEKYGYKDIRCRRQTTQT